MTPLQSARLHSATFLAKLALPFLLLFVIYAPSLSGSWVWDDDWCILHHTALQSPSGFWKVWVSWDAVGNYYPITSTVEWLEWQSFGNYPPAFRIVSLCFHGLSALLLWRLFIILNIRYAYAGCLLFVVHPIMVESGAWPTELRNTLSLFFMLASILAFLKSYPGPYLIVRSPYFWAALAIIFAGLAALSKVSTLMLTPCLLLYLWYRDGWFSWAQVMRLLGLFYTSVLLSMVVICISAVHLYQPVPNGDTIPAPDHWSYNHILPFYFLLLSHTLLPINLLPVYPPLNTGVVPIIMGVSLLFLIYRVRTTPSGRALILGIGWFTLNLLPPIALELHHEGVTSYDHLGYISSIGIIGLATAWFGRFNPSLARPILALIILVYGMVAHAYCRTFHDNLSLWSVAAPANPQYLLVQRNYGLALQKEGHLKEAQQQFTRCILLDPRSWSLYICRAEVEGLLGNNAAAQADLRQAQILQLNTRTINPHQ